MSTPLTCPSCGRECQPADQPAGEVKCQDCGRILAAGAADGPAASATPAPITTGPAPTPPPSLPESPRPAVTADGLMPCPHCGERILRNSTFCRYCREHVEDETPPWQRPGRRVRRDVEPHRANLILVLGILGFVIPLAGLGFGIAAWVMGRRDLARMDRREMDPGGRGTTQAGFICGIIASVLQGLLLLGCVGYIVLIILVMSIFMRSMPPRAPMPVPPAPPPPPVPGKAWRMPGGAPRLADYLPRRSGPLCRPGGTPAAMELARGPGLAQWLATSPPARPLSQTLPTAASACRSGTGAGDLAKWPTGPPATDLPAPGPAGHPARHAKRGAASAGRRLY
jgi:predicted RNA-binding Zn-ribbon protein involved in translation (DUF1610 family)